MTTPPGFDAERPSEAQLATLLSGENGAFVESLYEDWTLGRERVPESWRLLFESLEGRHCATRDNHQRITTNLGFNELIDISGES